MIAATITTALLALVLFVVGCRAYVKLRKLATPKREERDAMSFPPIDLVFGQVDAETDVRPLQRKIVGCFSAALLLAYVSTLLIRRLAG